MKTIKIIQILFAPNTNMWQGRLLGVGDDGNIYMANHELEWEKVIDASEVTE